jgi:hypothetical protein
MAGIRNRSIFGNENLIAEHNFSEFLLYEEQLLQEPLFFQLNLNTIWNLIS